MMVLLTTFILVAGFNAAKIGLDYWIVPWLNKWIAGGKKRESAEQFAR